MPVKLGDSNITSSLKRPAHSCPQRSASFESSDKDTNTSPKKAKKDSSIVPFTPDHTLGIVHGMIRSNHPQPLQLDQTSRSRRHQRQQGLEGQRPGGEDSDFEKAHGGDGKYVDKVIKEQMEKKQAKGN